MNKDKNTDYIPLENFDPTTSSDEIIEVQEENDQDLLIPKNNNVAQIEVDESDEDNIVVNTTVNNNDSNDNNNNGDNVSSNNESESVRNPFLPSTSSSSTSTPNSIQNKLKKSFLSEFRFFRKTPKKPVIHSVDGVFSNLNEKPEVRSDALPTYTQVTGEPELDPFYGYEVAYCHIGEFYGEMLFNSIPAGTWGGLIISALFSFIFDFIGFIMTFFLSTSHGTRKGSLIGLGLTLIRYGFYILIGIEDTAGDTTTDELESIGYNGLIDQWWFGKWVGFVMIGIAAFIIYHSITRFIRVLKAKEYADKHPERVPEINL
ncbi:hypothetical protein H8356DRAFT_1277730 [Neocallimastix lanati (nom. inval.)]|jgi:tetrahydromethanopterin S-methyltransferase subunit B|uniref:Uncharacterized protein n=1 Tax=Neocallimastix californiae TaxID=1754190 RepID=A0A1Y2EP40_9FUNG|nr:hypothetical protein H8356DRAFT_1277730 [Neocallimastix sp. JGI-2020a]ORY73309.1 hypothetical protein LY90DRAFT_503162 [Neocallimastix californiae]|eukprot:ORY73309.1 hypothetical protein LY90DRAFT_503162 [Neocallimastix californiae]